MELRKRGHNELDENDSFQQRRPFGSTQEDSFKKQKVEEKEEEIDVLDLKQQKALRQSIENSKTVSKVFALSFLVTNRQAPKPNSEKVGKVEGSDNLWRHRLW